MISSKEFTALNQEQKITLLIHILKDVCTTSPTLDKAYAYITSELPKNAIILDQIYAWLHAATTEHEENIIKKNIDTSKKIHDQWWKDFDEKYLDDLLSHA